MSIQRRVIPWQNYPGDRDALPLETPLGTVYLHPTGDEPAHLYIDANSDGKHLTVNGARYAVSLHLHQWPDGWGLSRTKEGRTEYYALHMSHKERIGQDGTPAARRKVLAVLVPAVVAWVAEHEETMRRARIANLWNDYSGAVEAARQAAVVVAEYEAYAEQAQRELQTLTVWPRGWIDWGGPAPAGE